MGTRHTGRRCVFSWLSPQSSQTRQGLATDYGNPELRNEIKELLVSSLHLERTPDSIDDQAPLFQTGLGLDSIDALELAVAIERKYRVTIPDEKVGKQSVRFRRGARGLCRREPLKR